MSLLELVIACCGVGAAIVILPLAIKSYKDMLESLK
jgi:hypothetical protein